MDEVEKLFSRYRLYVIFSDSYNLQEVLQKLQDMDSDVKITQIVPCTDTTVDGTVSTDFAIFYNSYIQFEKYYGDK